KRPISHNLASITVVADSAMTAAGLSTGLFALGDTDALQLREREKLAVFLTVRVKGGYRTAISSEFEKPLR
ncbi:thiamine biosynthesis protein ApbE, partial [Neisseria meningitidis]|uniref:FAD:protein FMN transferase n=1 Tax=Neisseria meningitidis TaxID=487 RepID=UPI000CB43AF6